MALPERGAPRGGEPSRRLLKVEYPDVQAFLADYKDNVSRGGTFISSQRAWAVGDQLQLLLTFPGLLEPLSLPGRVTWARIGEEPGIGVEFDYNGHPQLREQITRQVEAIRQGDPRVVARLVRVLVVDDNSMICEHLREGLNRQSNRCQPVPAVFLVHSASDGSEALAIVESVPIDMVVTDMYLPIMGGDALIRSCRELFGDLLPIIAISGGGLEAQELARAAGADLFLPKPLRLAVVFEAVAQLLGIDLGGS